MPLLFKGIWGSLSILWGRGRGLQLCSHGVQTQGPRSRRGQEELSPRGLCHRWLRRGHVSPGCCGARTQQNQVPSAPLRLSRPFGAPSPSLHRPVTGARSPQNPRGAAAEPEQRSRCCLAPAALRPALGSDAETSQIFQARGGSVAPVCPHAARIPAWPGRAGAAPSLSPKRPGGRSLPSRKGSAGPSSASAGPGPQAGCWESGGGREVPGSRRRSLPFH